MNPLRWALLAVIQLILFGFAGGMFWYQDWRYSLPTERPVGLEQPAPGTQIAAPDALMPILRRGRPVVIHFLNPRCPCSQFNLDHIRDLARQFSSQVEMVSVVEFAGESNGQDEYDKLHLRLPVVMDPDGSIGKRYGIYSTPQAVLLDRAGRLYFRGNYNRSRYCADEGSQFARLALVNLLHDAPQPVLPRIATQAYGCPLPRRASRIEGRF